MLASGISVGLDVLVAKGGTGTEVNSWLDEVPVLARGDDEDAVVRLSEGGVQGDAILVDQDQGSGEEVPEEGKELNELLSGNWKYRRQDLLVTIGKI